MTQSPFNQPDPRAIPTGTLDDQAVQQFDQAEEEAEQVRKRQAQMEAEQRQQSQAAAEAVKSAGKSSHETKDPKQFGLGENLQELGNAAVGGLTDTVNSVVGVTKFLDPKFYEKGQENYKPQWVPFDENNSPVTRTVWGGLLRGAIEFGSLAVATKLTAGAAAAGFAGKIDKASKAANWLAKGPQLSKATGFGGKAANLGRRMGHSAAVGAVSDTISNRSSENNLAAEIVKIKPEWEDALEPIATNEGMSPAQRTMMNTLEGLGLGVIADGVLEGVGAGFRRIRGSQAKPTAKGTSQAPVEPSPAALRAERIDAGARAEADAAFQSNPLEAKPWDALTEEEQEAARSLWAARNKIPYYENPQFRSDLQRVNEAEVGVQRLERDPEGVNGFDPYINRGGDYNQGRALSAIPDPDQTLRDVNTIDSDWRQSNGSPNPMLTERMLDEIDNSPIGERTAIGDQKIQEIMGSQEFKAATETVRLDNSEFERFRKAAAEGMPEQFVMGRPMFSVPEEEIARFVGPELPSPDGYSFLSRESLYRNNLVISALSKEMRDIANGSLSIIDQVDVTAKDAQLDMLMKRYRTALVLTKRSTAGRSAELNNLKIKEGSATGQIMTPEQFAQRTAEIEAEIDDNAAFIKSVIDQDPTDETLRAVMTAISMSDGSVKSLEDVDRFFRNWKAGAGKGGGTIAQELMTTMTHSVLSSTVTPARAVVGTSLTTYMRPIATAVGYLVGGDIRGARSALAQVSAMNEALGETFQLFGKRLKANFTGNYTPDSGTTARFYLESPTDVKMNELEVWVKERGTDAEKAAFFMANSLHKMNKNPLLTWSVRAMEAADVAFHSLSGRARLREIAWTKAMDEIEANNLVIDSRAQRELVLRYEEEFRSMVFNPDGSLRDEAAQWAAKEAAMTLDMPNAVKKFDEAFRATPWLRPFLLFPQTQWNAIELLAKNTPILNRYVKEVSDIKNLPLGHPDLRRYGIDSVEKHLAEQALIRGREAIGFGVVGLGAALYMNGNITGNGPRDPELRRFWMENLGWRPRSIKMGDRWVSYETFEPFNSILSFIADVGDMQQEMGDKFVSDNLGRLGHMLTNVLVEKSFFAGIRDLGDLLEAVQKGDDKRLARFAGGLANNMIPLSSLRNQMGKVLMPGMRELDAGLFETIQRRNPYFFPDLPYKTDVFTGERINFSDPTTRMFNAVSPIQMNPDASPVKQLVQRSLFDTKLAVTTLPGGGEEVPANLRSRFQYALGKQGVGAQLEQLFKRPDVIASIQQMESDRASGKAYRDPMSYPHNRLQSDIWNRAKRSAWLEVQQDPNAQQLIQQRDAKKLENRVLERGNFQRADQIKQLRDFAQ